MAATAEVLPAGNVWQFSERNDFEGLQPGPRRRENTQPTGLLLDVATHVQERFVVRGWHLVALVEDLQQLNDRTPPHLMVIFTHTTRVALIDRWPRDIDQFIHAGARKAADSRSEYDFNVGIILPLDDPINQVLMRANFIARTMHAKYNLIRIGGRGFLQTGVGYFDIGLVTHAEAISDVDQDIEELMRPVRPMQEEREALRALKVPNPVSLFQTR